MSTHKSGTDSSEDRIYIWDAVNGELLIETNLDAPGVFSSQWSPDGKLLASGSRDGAVRLWGVLDR